MVEICNVCGHTLSDEQDQGSCKVRASGHLMVTMRGRIALKNARLNQVADGLEEIAREVEAREALGPLDDEVRSLLFFPRVGVSRAEGEN